jgi:hypothetical protein
LTGFGAVVADGGVDAPAGQHASVRGGGGEDSAGVVGVRDGAGTLGKCLGDADR